MRRRDKAASANLTFQNETRVRPVLSAAILSALFMIAAAPPSALILMQRDARRVEPYVSIDVSGEPAAIALVDQKAGLNAGE